MADDVPFYCEFVDVQTILTFQKWSSGDTHGVESTILKYGNAVRHRDIEAARYWYRVMKAFITYRASGWIPTSLKDHSIASRKPGTEPFFKFEQAFRENYKAGPVPPW